MINESTQQERRNDPRDSYTLYVDTHPSLCALVREKCLEIGFVWKAWPSAPGSSSSINGAMLALSAAIAAAEDDEQTMSLPAQYNTLLLLLLLLLMLLLLLLAGGAVLE